MGDDLVFSHPPKPVVDIPVSVEKSFQGKYFLGQSGPLVFGVHGCAWAALVNPPDSGVDMFLAIFTVSNFSDRSLVAEVWFNKHFSGGTVSSLVSTTNFTLDCVPEPEAQIRYSSSSGIIPASGINVFDRVVSPVSTMADEKDGKYVFAPGDSFGVILAPLQAGEVTARVALGWWEEPTRHHHSC